MFRLLPSYLKMKFVKLIGILKKERITEQIYKFVPSKLESLAPWQLSKELTISLRIKVYLIYQKEYQYGIRILLFPIPILA